MRAYRVSDRGQLIGGGPRALGDVGDYMLDNDRIRVVMQNAGYSRGFGVYGGGIIDADLRRFDEQGRNESNRRGGHDIFAEMFPSFFFRLSPATRSRCSATEPSPTTRATGPITSTTTPASRWCGPRVGRRILMLLKVFNSLFLNYILPTTLQTPTDRPSCSSWACFEL